MSRPRKKDKHLPSCVHFRHGAYYYVKYGKWERLGTDLTEALIEYSRKISTPKGGMDDLIDRAYKAMCERKTRPLSPNTKLQYQHAATRLKAALIEFQPQQIKPKHIAAIKAQWSDTPNMTNRIISFLRSVFDYAVEWQEVEANPCLGIKRLAEGARDRYITDAEYISIRAAASERLKLVMDICYLTGQRISDVLSIRLNDISDDGIAFKQQKTGAKLVINSPDLPRVIEAAKALPKPKYVEPMTLFFNRRGIAPSYKTVYDEWVRACEIAGVQDANPHDLRAKAGTDAEKQGLNATALLGHTDPKQTETYLRDRKTPHVSGPSFGQHLAADRQK